MDKKIVPIVFLLGALAGYGLSVLLSPDREAADVPATVEGPSMATDDNSALLARIQEQEREIISLKSQLSEDVPTKTVDRPARIEFPPELLPQPKEQDTTESIQLDEPTQLRLDRLVAEYGLTGSQQSQLAEVFMKRRENLRALGRGEAVAPFNLDEAISGILTEDQFASYVEDSQDEIYDQAELIATTQLVRLAESVQLSADQESMVYEAVHATAQEWMISRQTGDPFDMQQALDQRLGTILTNQQLSDYLEMIGEGSRFGLPGDPELGP